MELQITGKNVKLVPAVRKYIERKLGKPGRHLSDIIDYKVEVSEEKTKSPQQHFVVQVTINSSGYKGKLYEKGRGSSLARGGFSEEAEEKQPVSRVVKVKRFAIKPMSVAEAIDQMELLGHDFFLFLNADTEKVNLVYRRRDGSYGLIEPELG